MDIDEQTYDQPPVLIRTRDILLHPARTWPSIAVEPATIGGIYRRHVLIVAAFPPILGLAMELLQGHQWVGLHLRAGIGSALGLALSQYATSLILVLLLAMTVNALAPRFGGRSDPVQAFKLAGYAGTAAWIAGGLATLPSVGWLAAGQSYSLYLLYTGLSPLMRTPADKRMPYAITTAIVAGTVLLAVALTSAWAGRTIERMPGLRSSLDRLEVAARQLEAEAREVAPGASIRNQSEYLNKRSADPAPLK